MAYVVGDVKVAFRAPFMLTDCARDQIDIINLRNDMDGWRVGIPATASAVSMSRRKLDHYVLVAI